MKGKMINYEVYEQDRHVYMKLHYEYETLAGVFSRYIPKVDLGFTRDRMPVLFESSDTSNAKLRINNIEYPVRLTNNVSGELMSGDKIYYVDKLVRQKIKKMTLSEIEEELGYKIEIVDE